jgi:two-component system, sensor histidine kinase and response regulator
MKKILVIEDEEPVRQNLVELLNVEGYQPLEAKDGEQGVRIAWDMLPDLILCDITMPRLDGFGVLSRLSRDPATAAIPFIFLTARSEREDLRRGMNLGADDYITKPFSIDDVLQAIERRLEKRGIIEEQAEKKLVALSKTVRLALPGEMLSPLSVIISSSELLSNRQDVARLDAGQTCSIGHEIHRAAGMLLRSIQNYMLFTELESIQANPARLRMLRDSRVYSASLAVTEMATLKASQDHRDSDLLLQVEDAPLCISEMYLQRIVEELLDNAFRNSPSGSPVVVTGTVHTDRQQYVLRVTDKGRGISPEHLAVLLGRFQPEAWSSDHLGQETGLVIIRRLVELHEGQFGLQSQPMEANTVEISLPLSA